MEKLFIPKDTIVAIKIEEVEKTYDATYVGDFTIKSKSGEWANFPIAIFYQKNPPHGYSNYFAIYYSEYHNSLMITSGKSVTDSPIPAIKTDSGQVIWSRYRHDMRWSDDGTCAIDGGRDYVKVCGEGFTYVNLHIINGEVYVGEV